jgi:hypothetical protein
VNRLAAVCADRVGDVAQAPLERAGEKLPALFVDFGERAGALVGVAFPLVEALGDVVVDFVPPFAHLPLVHATESNAWLVVCLSGRNLDEGNALMGAYDNDRRVVALSNGDYAIAGGDKGPWTVRRIGNKWASFDGQGVRAESIGWLDTADEAIAGVIGGPR